MSWDAPLESGLRDDYDATIVNSRFGTDARYQNGQQTVLLWTVEGKDRDGVPFEDDLLISIGGGWETHDGGKTVVHESGKADRNFGQQSHYGKIIYRCVLDPNGLQIGDVLKARGEDSKHAQVWDGLAFHFKRESFDYGGEIGSKEKVMPTAYLGEGGDVPAHAQAAPQAAPAAASTPAVNGNPLEAQVRAAAASSNSHDDFVAAAMAIPGVATDGALIGKVVDPNGIFAEVKG